MYIVILIAILFLSTFLAYKKIKSGERSGDYFESIQSRNTVDNFSNKKFQMWADDGFVKLMNKFRSSLQ